MLALLIVLGFIKEPLRRYVGYAVIAPSIVYLVYALLIIRLWMHLIAGLILFIAAFQWVQGNEWRKNPLAWLILTILTMIIIAIGGAIIGPILTTAAIIMNARKNNPGKA